MTRTPVDHCMNAAQLAALGSRRRPLEMPRQISATPIAGLAGLGARASAAFPARDANGSGPDNAWIEAEMAAEIACLA